MTSLKRSAKITSASFTYKKEYKSIIMRKEQVVVVLRNFESIVKFVKIVSKYPITIKVLCDFYELDAKSILSLFTLNPNKPVFVTTSGEEFPISLKEELRCFS